MPDITNYVDANAHWQEFEDLVASKFPHSDEFERILYLVEEMIYAALNSDIAPCMNRDDHKFSGGTYSDCEKCGEPEH